MSQFPEIESAEYWIISARGDLVISLEKGFPRGNLIVEKPDSSAPYQKWAVVYQSDEIYTFKSLIKEFKGSKKPYAQNSVVGNESEDPYIHGGALGVLATYKIRPVSPNPKDEPESAKWFTIGLPERNPLMVWTIVDDGANIILDEYNTSKRGQLWRFEKIDNLKV